MWYFAYGSNMQSATLRGRRGIEYRRAVPGRTAGWRLVLDKPPLVSVGTAMANIIADPASAVLGVLFEITDADLAHIDLTEGVLIGNYQRIEIVAQPLTPDAEPLTAFTLTSERRDPTLLPSLRYMALLIDGALEHGLPADYVDLLRAIPARPESAEAAQWRGVLDELMKKR